MYFKTIHFIALLFLSFVSSISFSQNIFEKDFPNKNENIKKGIIQRGFSNWTEGNNIFYLQCVQDINSKTQELPTITVINKSDLSEIKEYTLTINPSPDQPEKRRYSKDFVMMYSNKINYYLIYDVGFKDQVDGYDKCYKGSYLLCQKYSTDFKPIGNSFSLVDGKMETTSNHNYTSRIIFNSDSSKIAIYQASEFPGGNTAEIIIYDNSFNKVKVINVNSLIKTNSSTIRNIFFNGDIVSIGITDCSDPARSPISVHCGEHTVDYNIVTDQTKYFSDDDAFAQKDIRLKFFQYLPTVGNKYVLAFGNNRAINCSGASSNSCYLIEKKDGKMVKAQEWEASSEEIKTAKQQTLCFDDIFGYGNFKIYPIGKGKGYYLVASRNQGSGYCGTDYKDWKYFFVMVLDENGNFVRQKFFPIYKPNSMWDLGKSHMKFAVVNDNLIAFGSFSESIYKKGAAEDNKTMDKNLALLKITPEFNTTYYKISDNVDDESGLIFYAGNEEFIGVLTRKKEGSSYLRDRKLFKLKW